jgi:hypothetical protein
MVSPDNLLALLEGHNYYQFNQPDREFHQCKQPHSVARRVIISFGRNSVGRGEIRAMSAQTAKSNFLSLH